MFSSDIIIYFRHNQYRNYILSYKLSYIKIVWQISKFTKYFYIQIIHTDIIIYFHHNRRILYSINVCNLTTKRSVWRNKTTLLDIILNVHIYEF